MRDLPWPDRCEFGVKFGRDSKSVGLKMPVKLCRLRVMNSKSIMVLACLLLQACSTVDTAKSAVSSGASVVARGLSPTDIPQVLRDAQKQPYAPAGDGSCAAILSQIAALDGALGPDLDAPVSANNPGMIERGEGVGGNFVTDTLRNSAEGAIPYGGWLRKLSGADQSAKNAQAAITAGAVRRGFLKGMKQSQSCR
jgi:hypothetical protein